MLAGGIVVAEAGRLHIVPGVSTRDAHGVPDVMRGEETQIVGAVDEREDRVLAAMPGTHSKWACIEAGRIVDFMTFMTGETVERAAEAQHPRAPGRSRAGGTRRGLRARRRRAAWAPGGLAHDIFGARTLALMGDLAEHEVADWLSGVLIGREIRYARAWAQRNGYDGSRVRLIGEDALVLRYERAFAQADIVVERAPAHAAARGLWRIATSAGLVSALH